MSPVPFSSPFHPFSSPRKAGPQVERGFEAFLEARRVSQIARSQPR